MFCDRYGARKLVINLKPIIRATPQEMFALITDYPDRALPDHFASD